MRVAVVFAWRPGCPHRERSFRWVQERLAAEYPEWEQVVGESPDGPFSRTAAMLDGAAQTDADVLVFHDADVWLDGDLRRSAEAAALHGWAIPHFYLHRLSETSTTKFMDGHPLAGLELGPAGTQDELPYRGNPAGTLVVVRRGAFESAPPDPRFVGWGQEDSAWALALNMLVGPPWREDTTDLVHLWHPTQDRKSRHVGSDENLALLRRYRAAGEPAEMRALLDESRALSWA